MRTSCLRWLLLAAVLPLPGFAAEPVRVNVRTRMVSTNAFAPFSGHFQPYRFIHDPFGNVIMGGPAGDLYTRDIVTFKADPRGRTKWVSVFDDGLYDNFAGVTTDERGNVYVTGITESSSNFFERVTIKYSRDGQGIWTNRFDSGQANFNGGANIAADKQGNVAIVFHTLTNDVLAKLTPEGVLEWQQWLPNPSDAFYSPIYQVQFDSKGRVLVWGRSLNSETGLDQAQVMQFSPHGNLLWENTFSQSPFANTASVLTVDRNDRVLVAVTQIGSIPFPPFPGPDVPSLTLVRPWTVVAYSSAGAPEWTNQVTDVSVYANLADITTDFQGAVYVTGGGNTFFPSPLVSAVVTAKFSQDGRLRWRQSSNATQSGWLRFNQASPGRVTVLHDRFEYNRPPLGLIWTQSEFRYVRRD